MYYSHSASLIDNANVTMPTDEINQLLYRCALKEEKALEQLYAKTSGRLYALALSIVKRVDWAEEILQDAFVKAWNNADRFTADKSSAMTWLNTIVRNRSIDKIRQQKRNPLMQDAYVSDADEVALPNLDTGPADQTLISQDLKALNDCLGLLQAEQKRAILMSFYHGYTHQELSEKFAMPLGTVKGWVRRGLEKLRGCLNQ